MNIKVLNIEAKDVMPGDIIILGKGEDINNRAVNPKVLHIYSICPRVFMSVETLSMLNSLIEEQIVFPRDAKIWVARV